MPLLGRHTNLTLRPWIPAVPESGLYGHGVRRNTPAVPETGLHGHGAQRKPPAVPKTALHRHGSQRNSSAVPETGPPGHGARRRPQSVPKTGLHRHGARRNSSGRAQNRALRARSGVTNAKAVPQLLRSDRARCRPQELRRKPGRRHSRLSRIADIRS